MWANLFFSTFDTSNNQSGAAAVKKERRNTMKTLEQLRSAVENKTAKVLTVDLANELKGRKIATIYFGYRGQDGIDNFIVGDVKSEYEHAESITEGFEKEGNQARRWDAVMNASQLNRYKNTMILLTADGRNTFIRAHKENHGAFTCSDTARFVYFVEVE